MTECSDGDVAGLLQAMLQQQTAMLQVQAESVRLQRLLVERLVGGTAGETPASVAAATLPVTTSSPRLAELSAAPQAQLFAGAHAPAEISPEVVLAEPATEASAADAVGNDSPVLSASLDQNARGAR